MKNFRAHLDYDFRGGWFNVVYTVIIWEIAFWSVVQTLKEFQTLLK